MRPLPGLAREPEPARQIRFCATSAGVRVAYATAGRGPALLVPAAWMSHLELLWQDPAVRAFFAPLAARRTVIPYDKPGCGLSDPWPGRQTLDTDLQVLQAVADHLQLERFDLLGISTAAPLSIVFAARHPARSDG
jgi:pimeloyl-ACP methyl ester carboxylesterase